MKEKSNRERERERSKEWEKRERMAGQVGLKINLDKEARVNISMMV